MDRVDNVYWLFGLEGLDKGRCHLVTDRICGLEEIGLEQQQVRRPGLLPEEHHIQPRSKPLPKEPSVEERQAHELTHLPARSWCETCMKSFGLDDPTVFGEVVVTYQRYRSTTCLWDDGVRKS